MNVFACDCDTPPGSTFMTSLSTFVAELEVVRIDTICAEGDYKFQPIVLTKLKVINSFKGQKNIKYIWVNNAGSPDCERGIAPKQIGQKYIITGHFIKEKRFDKWINDASQRHFLYISSCGETVLDIEKSTVIGIITKNNYKKITEKYEILMKEDESKAIAYYEEIYNTKHHPDLVQKMTLAKFHELIKQ